MAWLIQRDSTVLVTTDLVLSLMLEKLFKYSMTAVAPLALAQALLYLEHVVRFGRQPQL